MWKSSGVMSEGHDFETILGYTVHKSFYCAKIFTGMSPAPLEIMYSRPMRYAMCLSHRHLIQVTPQVSQTNFETSTRGNHALHQCDISLIYKLCQGILGRQLSDIWVNTGFFLSPYVSYLKLLTQVETLKQDSGMNSMILHSIFAVQKISSVNNR